MNSKLLKLSAISIAMIGSSLGVQAANLTAVGASDTRSGLASAKAGSVSSAKETMRALSASAGMELSFAGSTKAGAGLFKIAEARSLTEVKGLAKALSRNGRVKTVEADVRRYPMAQNTPWGYTAVQAEQVSDSQAANTTVCIIDSGYEISNPDLPGTSNASGTNDSGTGSWSSAGGSHGTHVAGTIAALNNSIGIKGILPNSNVNLHIIKVFNADGWAYSRSLVSAVERCQDAGADVVNMSLGGSSSNNTERNGLQAVADANVLLIAAAGNDGNSTLSYPASYDSVVSVGAVDETGLHAEFSQYTSQVELAGPGEAILSTVAGDGRQGYISFGSTSLGDDRVLPQGRYTPSGSSYTLNNVNASVSGELAVCSRSGASKSSQYFTIEVPAGATDLTFNLSGGSGDADLYVDFGSQPTTSTYDCRPYKNGNEESCSFTNPAAGTWHIGIRAYSTFSGVTLDLSYQP